jgi:TolB protein
MATGHGAGEDYSSLKPGTNLQRTLDAWGKGPFCASCHNILYPLPPEQSPPQAENFVESMGMEPSLKRLTDGSGSDVSALYSPKGDRIFWVTDSQGGWTIWSMNDDGRDKKQLTSNDVISGWPSWSPDGQEITYWAYDPASKTTDIWKMNADGSTKVKLTSDGTYKGSPMWSPRGDRIAYTANQTGNMEVYVINTDGGGQKQLTTGHNLGYSLETRTTWNPDGVRLYYQALTFPLPPYTVTTISGDVAFVEIFMVNVDTGKESNLTPKLHENVRSVSSDGEKMACISLRSPNYGLWIMNTDGTNQTRLTWDGQGDRAPRFSPDGKKIVYWSIAYGSQPDIWLINVDGTNKTRLTTSEHHDIYPSWSPDGRKIIFESDRAGGYNIWQLTLDQPITVGVAFENCAIQGNASKALVTIRPTKDPQGEIELEKIGLHFDWNSEQEYYETKIAKTLRGPKDTYEMNLTFTVPGDAKLGHHFYDVKVEYHDRNTGATTGIYEHTAKDMEIGTITQNECNTYYRKLGYELERLQSEVTNRSSTIEGYFEYLLKPNAERFMKANDEYYQATHQYLAGDYQGALLRFRKVVALLGEQDSQLTVQNMSNLFSLTFLPVAIIIPMITGLHKKRGHVRTHRG